MRGAGAGLLVVVAAGVGQVNTRPAISGRGRSPLIENGSDGMAHLAGASRHCHRLRGIGTSTEVAVVNAGGVMDHVEAGATGTRRGAVGGMYSSLTSYHGSSASCQHLLRLTVC